MKVFFFICSFLITYFLTFKLIPFFRINFGQIPNKRSSHNKLTPSAGGIIFILISILFSSFNNFYIPFLYVPLALFGLFDDKYELKAILRYMAQLLTVSFIIILSTKVGILSILSSELTSISVFFLILISILFGTATINFINFMDGIDGLITGISIIFFISTMFISNNYNLLPIIGSLIGFLMLNWSPAKIFMGDVGSTFLGAAIFGELILSTNFYESIFLFFVISPILGDAFFCVLRRYFAKQNIFKPHKVHLYQRLCSGGLSHSNVALIYIFSSIFIAITYLLSSLKITFLSVLIIFLLGYILDRTIAFPFKDAIH